MKVPSFLQTLEKYLELFGVVSMPDRNIVIDTITKIEGNAGLKVVIEDGAVRTCSSSSRTTGGSSRRRSGASGSSRSRRFCPGSAARVRSPTSLPPSWRSSAQGIEVTEQTKTLRRLAYDGLMIRDHALHLYFFVLPDVLGVDSILDISDDPEDPGHTLLHDSFDIKRLGTDITNATVGAAIHAPWPCGRLPEDSRPGEVPRPHRIWKPYDHR